MTMPKGWSEISRDSSGYSENKKWLIKQIEYYLDTASKEINVARELVVHGLKDQNELLRDYRTIIISIAAISVAITIGLERIGLLGQFAVWFLFILIMILIGIVIWFEISRIFLSRIISAIEASYNLMDHRTYVLRGVAFSRASEMYTVNEYDLLMFADFSILVCGFRRESSEILKEASRSFFVKKFKPDLSARSEAEEDISNELVKMYKDKEPTFLNNHIIVRFFQTPEGRQYLNRFSKSPLKHSKFSRSPV